MAYDWDQLPILIVGYLIAWRHTGHWSLDDRHQETRELVKKLRRQYIRRNPRSRRMRD